MKTARLPATPAKCLILALTLLFLDAVSGLHAAPAAPKQPQPGAALQPPKSVQPPLPGIYSATDTPVEPDPQGHLLATGKPPNNNCGTAAGHYIYYYPGPGKSGALWVGEEPNSSSGQGRTYVGWDPNFYNPSKSGDVTPLRLDYIPRLFPWEPYPVAWLPPNSADPALFQPYPYGYRGSDIKTTFDSPTHFRLEGIWGWSTETCYHIVDLVRIGCAGNHTTNWDVSGGDLHAECQKYCELIPDGVGSSFSAVRPDRPGYWKCGNPPGPDGLPTVDEKGRLVCPCVVQAPHP